MTTKKSIDSFIKSFSKKRHFTKVDLFNYYSQSEPDLKDGTLRRRINILKNRGLIHEVGRGIYTFQNKQTWIPVIDKPIKSLYNKIADNYTDLNFTVWSTAWLGEFTNLQAFHYLVIISVEKDFAASVFEYLKETGLKNLYFKPDKKEINYYLGDTKETYIITTLITKSPVQSIEKNKIPKLEKILVDLFCDKDLFNAFQGAELKNIFRKAFDTYSINLSVLFNYSGRRGKKIELPEYLTKNLKIKGRRN